MRHLLEALVLSIVLSACSAAPPDVRVQEGDVTAQVSDVPVSLGTIVPQSRFRQGKRVSVLLATIFVREHGALRKQNVEVGDDLIINRKRWLVVDIVPGGPATAGFVQFRLAP